VLRANLERYHSPEVVEDILARVRSSGRSTLGLEEREVTILFADLKGFTSLAETIDPAIVANFLNEYYGLATSIVFEHGGTVNEYIGDSVMAIFGAPVPHPDHARRAVDTAVQLLRRVREPQGSRPQLQGVEVRVALNSGKVVVGSVGSRNRLKYAVIGDAVNVAARLESLAEPGMVTLGEATYRALGGEVECEDLGPTHLRGREKPIHVYRIQP
jgi:adenylate cyclase